MTLSRRVTHIVPCLFALFSLSAAGTSVAGGPDDGTARELSVSALRSTVELDEYGRGWRVNFTLWEGVDWEPMPVQWTKSELGPEGPGLTYGVDGRQVGVLFPGRPVARGADGFVIRWLARTTELVFHSEVEELCAGPIEIAMLGRDVAGEETLLRVTGEVTDARWLRKNCKAKG
jgi:hypothetical protein